MKHSTHQTGAESEIVVQLWAIREGYAVSIPTTEERYDMIVDDGNSLKRVQVKRGYFSDSLGDDTLSCDFRSGPDKIGYDEEDIDYFVIHNPRDDELYKIGVNDAPGSTHKKVSSWRDDMIWSGNDQNLSEWV